MELRDLLDVPELRLHTRAARNTLDRPIRWVFTTDLLDPARYLSGGELVLSGLVWRRRPEDSADFVATLASQGVAGLAAGEAAFGAIPDDLIEACDAYGIPLLEVPIDVSFATITECVMRRLTREREGDLAAVLGQRRRLATTLAAGEGIEGLLSTWEREVGNPCWVLTPVGRVISGTPSSPDDATATRLADAYLRAGTLPYVVRSGVATPFSLFPVTTRTGRRLASWFLACAGDHDIWPRDLDDSVTELTSLIAFERARLDERRRARWLVAEQLLRPVLLRRSEPAAAADGMHSAGVDLGESYIAVSLHVSETERADELACPLLEELFGSLDIAAVVGPAGEDAIGLVPLAGPSADLGSSLREASRRLEAGLGQERLRVGLGTTTRGADALREAIEEAQLARRIAALRPGRTSVLSCADVDSYALLLATVPEDVRVVFRRRLLGPVLDYDARHRSDLHGTLEEFLACSGSWSRCAQRLHVHVNTLRYRIHRVEELTGRSLARLEDRVDFFLALHSE